MLNIYKPTPRNTGSACSWTANIKEGNVFCSFIKQASWNDGTKTGSFEANKRKPEATLFTKFNLTEVAAILECIDTNREFKTYHNSEAQKLNINFKPYIRGEEQIGFSFSIFKKTDDVEVPFLIGFTYPEGRLLREFLITATQEIYRTQLAEAEEWRVKNVKSKTVTAKTAEAPVETAPEPLAQDETNLEPPI